MAGSDFSDYGLSFLKIDADEDEYSEIAFDSIEQEQYIENNYGRQAVYTPDSGFGRYSLSENKKRQEKRTFGSISEKYNIRTPETSENDMDLKIRQMTEMKRKNLDISKKQDVQWNNKQTESKRLKKQLDALSNEHEKIVQEKERKEHELLCEIELLKRELVRDEEDRQKIKEVVRLNGRLERENSKLKAHLHKIESEHNRERDQVFKAHNHEISIMHREQKRKEESFRRNEQTRVRELVRTKLNEMASKIKIYYENKYKEAVVRIKKIYDEKYEEAIVRIKRKYAVHRTKDEFSKSSWGWSTYH